MEESATTCLSEPINMRELFAALAAAQAEFPVIPRNATVKVQTKSGGSYTFEYAPLETIMQTIGPVLGKYGLGILQDLTAEGLRTTVFHKSGAAWTSSPMPVKPSENGPQALGSALTYIRRYQLSASLCLSTDDDDDGNRGEGNTADKKTRQTKVKDKEQSPPAKIMADYQAEIDAIDDVPHLNNWYKKHAKVFGPLEKEVTAACAARKQEILAQQQAKENPPMRPCPERDGNMIFEDYCNTDCKVRKGCPAWG